MKKKKPKIILFSVLSFLLISSIVTVWVTGYQTFVNSIQLSTNEDTGIEKSLTFFKRIDFDYEGFQQQYAITRVEIPSTLDDHVIPADFIVSKEEDADTVIMIHGLGGNRQSIFPIADLFLKEGYNVLAYDQRSAGENTAQYTTFGYFESCDTADCTAYLDSKLAKDSNIYLWGISYGAATAGTAVRHEIVADRISAVILDSPFSGARDMLEYNMSNMDIGIPVGFLIFCGNIYNYIKLEFTYAMASPIPYLAESDIPLLVIASQADEVTPFRMAEKIGVESKTGALVVYHDSEHADIFFDYPDSYRECVLEFYDKY